MQAANSVELFNMDEGSMLIQGIPQEVCQTSGCYLNLVYNVMMTKTKMPCITTKGCFFCIWEICLQHVSVERAIPLDCNM